MTPRYCGLRNPPEHIRTNSPDLSGKVHRGLREKSRSISQCAAAKELWVVMTGLMSVRPRGQTAEPRGQAFNNTVMSSKRARLTHQPQSRNVNEMPPQKEAVNNSLLRKRELTGVTGRKEAKKNKWGVWGGNAEISSGGEKSTQSLFADF